MTAKRKIPKFKTEREEAAWWDSSRKTLDNEFIAAARAGSLRKTTSTQLAARVSAATKVISLRVADEDLRLAREQAARKGLPYQTYLKSLIHEALRRTG